MDYVLGVADPYFFTPYIYPESWPVDWWVRQYVSLYSIVCVGGAFLYLLPATFMYFFFFDHRLMKHEKFIPGQVKLEIMYALWSIPYMSIPTCFLFVLELQGYSKLYENIDDMPYGKVYLVLNIVLFLLFTDMCIYWIHRWLHLPIFYGPIHKPHHRWLVCTPFASHAFHPIDGFMQSLPYHLYAFIMPMHKLQYLILFTLVNFWSTSIHDEVYAVPKILQPFVNGSAHHTDHHLYFNYNYGQYFTLWDRIGGSFREPSAFEDGKSIYDDLDRQLKRQQEESSLKSPESEKVRTDMEKEPIFEKVKEELPTNGDSSMIKEGQPKRASRKTSRKGNKKFD